MNRREGWLRAAILPLLAAAAAAALLWIGPATPGSGSGLSRSTAVAARRALGTPTPTATRTPTLTPSPRPTHTPSPTPSPTPTPTATPTPSPAPTHTPTPTPSPTPTQAPTPDGTSRTVRVPVLMYHHIEDAPSGADAVRRDLSVSPQAFEQQLHYLVHNGYHSITLNQLAEYLAIGRPLPEKPVILTFDDGYRDAYQHAYPLLRRYGMVGTFFLTTGPIDAQNPDWLTWDQVSEMSAAGIRFEPHGYSHDDLRGRRFSFLVFQILASSQAIEARTGTTCRFFAYPSGRYDPFVVDVLRSANFWGAVTTEQGATHTNKDLFALRRVRVQGADDLDTFARKLGLDW